MHRFRDGETTNNQTIYSNDAVRQVLARAAEIESQADVEREAMTPSQIQALGRELGLSTDAVRCAMGELPLHATVTVTTPATVIRTPPGAMTQAHAKAAYLPILQAAVLGPPAVFLVSWLVALSHGNRFIVPSLVALGLSYLFARAGWIARRARLSFLGLIFAPLIMLLASVAHGLGGGGNIIPTTEEGIPALLMAPLMFVVHLGGTLARKWWDNLPQASDC